MIRKMIQSLGLSLVMFAALFSGTVLPVAAATPLGVTVIDLLPGSMVRLQFANLPANVQFAVMMGAGGTRAVGAPTVAHVYSADGGYVAAWIEILSELSGSSAIDVRIDDGAGHSATTSFVNTSSFVVPTVPVTVSGGSGGAVAPAANRTMKVLHVEKGGIVVAAISNLPANTSFTVSVGVAGTQGFGGNVVGHLDTGDTGGLDTISTFEIPETLSGEATLDLRLEGGGVVYFVNFKNVDL